MDRSRMYENFLRVGDSLLELENLYHQVRESCVNLDKYLPGSILINVRNHQGDYSRRQATFTEEMQLIGIFLKLIGKDDQITVDEEELLDVSDLTYFLNWVEMPVYLERQIQWLRNVLPRCRQAQNVVQRAQQRFLERRYAPGGPMYRQAQERFTDRSY